MIGKEDEFILRWTDWVSWSRDQGLAAPALLLRDSESPHTFVSFGPWESIDAVRSWRSLPGYQERVARLCEVIDHFDAHTLEVVGER